MTHNIDDEISDALYTKVIEFASWLLRPGLYSDLGVWIDKFGWLEDLQVEGAPFPLAMPNVPFPPVDHPKFSEGIHLVIQQFRNGTLNPTHGDERTYIGILQISVVDPAQEGTLAATRLAGLIADQFGKNTSIWTASMNRIVVYEHPSVLTMVQDGHKSIVPVSIPYRCFQA